MNILKPREVQKLKLEFKTKYAKTFKEEEKTDKTMTSGMIKSAKKVVRDKFLNEFFIPLRKDFEKDRLKYLELFPIKDIDLVPVKVEVIYAFENVISEKKV